MRGSFDVEKWSQQAVGAMVRRNDTAPRFAVSAGNPPAVRGASPLGQSAASSMTKHDAAVALVRRCRLGSEAAYAELIHQHSSRLRTIACWLTGSRATGEEVAQATLLDLFREIERGRLRPPLGRWLDVRCVRGSRRTARRRKPGGSASVGSSAGEDGVRAALDRLPFTTQAVLVLRFIVGLDMAEVAATLDLPLDTCRQKLCAGFQALGSELGGEEASRPAVGVGEHHADERTAAGPTSVQPHGGAPTHDGALSPCK